MDIHATREALSRIFYQRCFWLFVVLLTLIGAVSFVPASDGGRLILNVVNMFLNIATVAAVGRTVRSFLAALLLAVPAMWFQYLGLWHDDDSSLAVSWLFSAVLYFITVAYLPIPMRNPDKREHLAFPRRRNMRPKSNTLPERRCPILCSISSSMSPREVRPWQIGISG